MLTYYFEGYYFKHQKDGQTIAFIPGKARCLAFLQVITNEKSYNLEFPSITMEDEIRIGNCRFGTGGIIVNLPEIRGEIRYHDLTPIKYDIMGPFQYFPMECRHSIISMRHRLEGSLKINGQTVDFTGGTGYIEKDSGRSFPKQYVWVQCNNFSQKCGIMVSVAHVPFMGFSFQGCICVINYEGREYRLATYLGVKIEQMNENHIVLRQGKYLLNIDIQNNSAHKLLAPENGSMTGIVRESNASKARFRFFDDNKLLFDLKSNNTSFEYHI